MKKVIFLMAYLNMISQVIIGNIIFPDIESFTVTESLKNPSTSATITIPRQYRQIAGKPVLDFFNVKDKVEILAGYNNRLRTVYKGYVSEISADVPIVIECDSLYIYRQNNIFKSYANVSLRSLLEEHFKGFVIDCPNVELGKLLLDNVSSYKVLEQVRNDYGFYTHVYDNILHVQFAYDFKPGYTKKHNYVLSGKDCNIKSNGLKWSRQKDFDVKVNVTIIRPDGSKQQVKTGTEKESAVTDLVVYNKTESEARQIGSSRLQQVNYSGFKGTLNGFGIPRVHAGDSIEIKDPEAPERLGTYLVDQVAINYGPDGYERVSSLAFKLST